MTVPRLLPSFLIVFKALFIGCHTLISVFLATLPPSSFHHIPFLIIIIILRYIIYYVLFFLATLPPYIVLFITSPLWWLSAPPECLLPLLLLPCSVYLCLSVRYTVSKILSHQLSTRPLIPSLDPHWGRFIKNMVGAKFHYIHNSTCMQVWVLTTRPFVKGLLYSYSLTWPAFCACLLSVHPPNSGTPNSVEPQLLMFHCNTVKNPQLSGTPIHASDPSYASHCPPSPLIRLVIPP